MLHTQIFLKKKGLESLLNKYSLEVISSNDGRLLLNYNQIKSPKTKKIVRECRSLCLSSSDFSLISRSFYRFFNYREYREDMNKFNWNKFWVQEKKDGSLISLYWYNNQWQVQTKGSFGDGTPLPDSPTWRNIFLSTLPSDYEKWLSKKISYSFELCSPYNTVVKIWEKPQSFLLSAFEGERELSVDELLNEANLIGIQTAPFSKFSKIDEVLKFVNEGKKYTVYDLFEGFVLRDNNNVRFKIKTEEYLRYHKLTNNGNILLTKNIIPWILQGEEDELIATLPYTRGKVLEVKDIMQKHFNELSKVWLEMKDITTIKQFVLSLPSFLKLKSLLISAYRQQRQLDDIWRESGRLILKELFESD